MYQEIQFEQPITVGVRKTAADGEVVYFKEVELKRIVLPLAIDIRVSEAEDGVLQLRWCGSGDESPD